MSFVTRLSLHETLTLIGLLIRGSPEVSSRNIGCKVQDRERERVKEKMEDANTLLKPCPWKLR